MPLTFQAMPVICFKERMPGLPVCEWAVIEGTWQVFILILLNSLACSLLSLLCQPPFFFSRAYSEYPESDREPDAVRVLLVVLILLP